MVPTVEADRVTEMSTGSVRWVAATLRMAGGMVAENSAVCRSRGASVRIRSTSSAKPIRSISSASSSTRKRSPASVRVRRSRWSMIRPGVPTTTWAPAASAAFCGRNGAPP